MKKETVFVVVLLAALIAFAAGRWSNTSTTQGTQAEPAAVAAGAEGAAAGAGLFPATVPVKGADTALVTIFEVSDFQCPFCSRVGPTMKKVLEEYPKDVRVAWINHPLPFHDRATPASTAAMAAHRQGKFWEMHDKLFANQQDLTDENFKKWAKELGLDLAKFEADLKDPAIAKLIATQLAAGEAVGAQGTPAFFINGKLLSGAQPYENFKKEIDEALAAAKPLAAAGKSGLELLEATAAARDKEVGAKVIAYFVKGEAPPAQAAEAPAEAKEPEAAALPPDAADLWKVPVDAKKDAIKGDSDKALVTIVEFSDFQCPFCSRAANTVTEVEKAYGDKVRIVFKHTPLPFHDKARPASQAAIAAGKQGKFWEFYDKCFANQQQLSEENFTAWAKELGLNMDKFDADRKSAAANAQVDEDQALGQSVGVRGTPAFLINGHKLVGAQPLPMFKLLIDQEIKKAQDSGKKGAAYYDELIAKGKVFTELNETVNEIDIEGMPFKGPKNAPVTIVEFSDFQCPFCSRIAEPVKGAMEKHEGKVKVVFAHFPLGFHQNARPAATAAQEAWEQGGSEMFWKLHDLLFANQRELSDEKIDALAKEAGVNMAKLAAAKAAKKYDPLFDKIQALGGKVGVEGTPTMFINGRKYEPATGYSAEGISKTIDGLLAKK